MSGDPLADERADEDQLDLNVDEDCDFTDQPYGMYPSDEDEPPENPT